MKNITRRIIAVFAVLAVAASCFTGCGAKKNTSESSSDSSSANSAPMQYPFVVGSAAEGNELTAGDPNENLDAPDPVASESSSADNSSSSGDTSSSPEADAEPETEIIEVTEPDGQPATIVVVVKDENDQPVTDASGAEATEIVVATEVVTKPAPENEGGDESSAPEATAAPSYKAKEDGRYAMWLDISKDENFYFEGDMIKVKFKVKDNIPDGDYKFRISPDLSDIAGVAIDADKVIDGIIRVNNGKIDPVDVSGETGMVFYGDNVACKQGDTIEMNINIKNNSGLAAFCIWFYFDSNAVEFISGEPSGEFEPIARGTEIGGQKDE